MVMNEKTNLRDNSPNNLHRTLGSKCLMIDVDCVEFHFRNGQIEFAAIVDYKHPNSQSIDLDSVSAKVQIAMAEKLNIPFFLVFNYQEDYYDVKMMLVQPVNKLAKEFMIKCGKSGDKPTWLSIRNYSRFLHNLRRIPNDVVAQNLLSNEYKEYTIPGE